MEYRLERAEVFCPTLLWIIKVTYCFVEKRSKNVPEKWLLSIRRQNGYSYTRIFNFVVEYFIYLLISIKKEIHTHVFFFIYEFLFFIQVEKNKYILCQILINVLLFISFDTRSDCQINIVIRFTKKKKAHENDAIHFKLNFLFSQFTYIFIWENKTVQRERI